MRHPQVFYTYEWARAVQLGYGRMLCPLLVLGYDEEGRLMGVAALAAPKGQPVSFLCANTGDYCDFVAAEQDAGDFVSQVLRVLQREGHGGDLVLTNFPEDSPSYAALTGAAKLNKLHIYRRTAYLCAQVRLSEITADDGTLALPRQKMVRRSLRALGSEFPVALAKKSSWQEIGPILPKFFRAHVARFLFTERISNLIRPERRLFLVELARLLSADGWIYIFQISVGSRSIAWNYGFEFGTAFWYQPTFVNDLEKYSPGLVLLSKLIEDAATDARIHTVDLGLGAETYKEAFANATRRTMYVTLHRSALQHWKEIARYQVAAAIAERPRLEKAMRNLRAKANRGEGRMRKYGLMPTLAWILSRVRSWIASREEVFFFDASLAESKRPDCAIVPITHELLADAAMRSYEDEETLQYLMRAALRLRKAESQSFALIDANGRPVHFAWATAFDGFFLSELNARVDAPSANCVMLFDCWTPAASRGGGYYAQAVNGVARLLREQGKSTWIFSAGSNVASLRGLAKAGVQQRYSLVRKRLFGWQWIEGTTPHLHGARGAEVSAQT